jgi:hypothetical protein
MEHLLVRDAADRDQSITNHFAHNLHGDALAEVANVAASTCFEIH